MIYTLVLFPRAERDLNRFHGETYQRLEAAIDALALDPRPRGCLKMSDGDEWRIRVGTYRICYLIDDQRRRVLITRVGHRREIYDR